MGCFCCNTAVKPPLREGLTAVRQWKEAPRAGLLNWGGPLLCPTTETVVTCVFHQDSGKIDIWLTESDEHGQFELMSYCADARPAIVNLFDRLRNTLAHEAYIGAIATEDSPRPPSR